MGGREVEVQFNFLTLFVIHSRKRHHLSFKYFYLWHYMLHLLVCSIKLSQFVFIDRTRNFLRNCWTNLGLFSNYTIFEFDLNTEKAFLKAVSNNMVNILLFHYGDSFSNFSLRREMLEAWSILTREKRCSQSNRHNGIYAYKRAEERKEEIRSAQLHFYHVICGLIERVLTDDGSTQIYRVPTRLLARKRFYFMFVEI